MHASQVSTNGQGIFITGNHPLLGNWNPGSVPLYNKGDGFWEIGFEFPQQTNLAFKLTRGSWDSEEVLENGIVRGNRYYKVQRDETIRIDVANWRDLKHKPSGEVVGNIKYHKKFRSRFLKYARAIVVWLPPSYEEHTKKSYPVLYVHDGQNIFDPATAFACVEWQVDETADRLIREKKMEEVIIVGIYNTPDRMQEYTDTKKGSNYIRFLTEELKPFIDKSYRTKPDRENTATMGSSLGGLISLYLIWRKSDLFSKAACLSASLGWKRCAALKMIQRSKLPLETIQIYFDHGALGEEGEHSANFKKLKRIFINKGMRQGVDFKYFFDLKGDHSEAAWAKRVWRPLTFFFPKKL